VLKEILHRWRSFVLGVFAVTVAIGSLTGALTLLQVHDHRTHEILTEKEEETKKKMAMLQDEMRKATLKLSFNLLILPKQQSIPAEYSRPAY